LDAAIFCPDSRKALLFAPCLVLLAGPPPSGAQSASAELEARRPTASSSAAPSASEEPAKTRPVRVVHRHRRVGACTLSSDRERSCKSELTDADSSATLSLWLDEAPSSLNEEQRRARVTFPRQVGAQEQKVELAIGTWHLIWEEAGLVRRLPVEESSLPVVELSTISGSCERYRDGCRVSQAPVLRRVSVSDEAGAERFSRL
jgi:hypothetical protein